MTKFKINLYTIDELALETVEYEANFIPDTVYQMRKGQMHIFERFPRDGKIHDGSVDFIETVARDIG